MPLFGKRSTANETKDSTPRDKKLLVNQKLVQSMKLDEKQKLNERQIRLGHMLGEGGFAKVYKCELDGQVAVAKVIPSDKLNDEMTYLLTNECTIWSRLCHRNIVGFYGMAVTSQSVLLVCEYFVDGSLQELHDRLRKSGAPSPEPAALVENLQQIASGMEYLHALEPPVLHRDLKSANILLEKSHDGRVRLAIADFGLARYQAATGFKMTAETGSYRWMAPEVIRHEEYNAKCDVYSFAILAWEMLTYGVPFDTLMPVEAAFAVAREAKRPTVPLDCPPPVKQMLSACWAQAARCRPSFAEICSALAEEASMLAESAALADAAADLAVGDHREISRSH